MLFNQANHVGYEVSGVFGFKTDANFEEIQRKAFENTKKAVDEGIPTYGWELEIPEYYVVNVYDDDAYHYSGVKFKPYEPLKWNKLSTSEIGVLELYQIKPHTPSDDKETVKNAFLNVFKHNNNSEGWIFEKYKSGSAAFDLWIDSLINQKADLHGNAYCAQVWAECRMHAVEFLIEARKRIPQHENLLKQAFEQYKISAEKLQEFTNIFSFHRKNVDDLKNETKINAGIDLLHRCRDAEMKAIETLETLVNEM
ncbi:MAG: hypothetical protein K8S87_07630 [Planctomycetes bacterium]|nr:hypothetical protein [Planctomycetota bacterium]